MKTVTIQQIDDSRVIIALCKEDMEILSLEYNTMGFTDPHSRNILKKLLNVAGSRTGLTVTNHSVVVEAMPYDKGCLLVITLLPKGAKPKKYRIKHCEKKTMFTFENAESLLCCAKQLYLKGFLLMGSHAYEENNKYHLIVNITKDVPKDAIYILREYALVETRKKLQIANIAEHGNVIAHNQAILTIGSALCQ